MSANDIANEYSLPPGPGDSVEECLEAFNRDPFLCLETMSKAYGTMFTLNLGTLGNEPVDGIENNGSWVFLTRPHQIKLMYEANGSVVSGAMANKVFFGTTEASVGYIDGKDHKRRRSLLHPVFNGKRDFTDLFLRVARRCIAQWPKDTPFRLFDALQRLTSEVIVSIVCGNMDEDDRTELRAMLPSIENARYSRQEIIAADHTIREFVAQRIDGYEHRAALNGSRDMMAMLLRFANEGDRSLTHEVIRDEIFSLLYTGFSTTANTLSWVFTRLSSEPAVRKKLADEVQQIIGDGPITKSKLNKLTYLDAVIKETLRLHPVTPLNGVRMLQQPMEIDGYVLPPGTVLVHCAYLLQRSDEVYPDPLQFVPERFVGRRIDPYAWGAFGGGSRTCIGRGLALDEMRTLLTLVTSEVDLEVVGDIPKAQQQGFFMAPDNGAPCVVKADAPGQGVMQRGEDVDWMPQALAS